VKDNHDHYSPHQLRNARFLQRLTNGGVLEDDDCPPKGDSWVIDFRFILAAIALALMLIGVEVFRRQTKATSCPLHNHLAGRIAVIAGWVSLIGGMVLMGYVIVFLRK
jgi:hypothetical protein